MRINHCVYPFFYGIFVATNNKMSKYSLRPKAFILLEDGTVFFGKSVGIDGTATGAVCFNTGMTGYQEIFTDPSYYGQLMVATNAHIGNYGVNDEEVESNQIQIAGLICKNFNFEHSRPAADGSLFDQKPARRTGQAAPKSPVHIWHKCNYGNLRLRPRSACRWH